MKSQRRYFHNHQNSKRIEQKFETCIITRLCEISVYNSGLHLDTNISDHEMRRHILNHYIAIRIAQSAIQKLPIICVLCSLVTNSIIVEETGSSVINLMTGFFPTYRVSLFVRYLTCFRTETFQNFEIDQDLPLYEI